MTKRLLLSALFATVFALFSYAQDNNDELTTVFSENFDAFTEGSEDAPGTTDISGYTGKLKKTIGWNGSKVYEAGGKLLIEDGGNLQTSRYNLSANSGIFKLSMRVKSKDSYGSYFTVKVGYSTTKNVLIDGDGWKDVAIVLDGGKSSTQITITSIMGGYLIDEIKAETGASLVGVPEAMQPSQADGTSFTAKWGKAAAASVYLLDVYSKAANGDKNYVLHDEEVKSSSAHQTTITRKVTGLDANTTYYFQVRARNANGVVSDYSKEIKVIKVLESIAAPKALPATDVTATSFTANWEAVAEAKSYNASLYCTKTLAEDATVNVITEDFSKITAGSLESIEFGLLSGYLNDYTNTPGWYTENPAFANGYLALSPFSGNGLVRTPALDLALANGAFSVNINMAEGAYGKYYAGYELTFNLYDGNTETPVETKTVTLEQGFKDYTVEFTKGTKESYVEIVYGGNNNNKLFIDNIAVAQKLAAGESYTQLVETKEKIEGTSCTFDADLANKSNAYYYVVEAVGETVSSDSEIVDIYSVPSNTVNVVYDAATSISLAPAQASANVAVQGGKVVVTLSADAPVAVYSLGGNLIANIAAKAGVNTIDTAERVVIVKVAGKAYKVAK